MVRRNYVLGRMFELGYIDDEVWEAAVVAEDTAMPHRVDTEAEAPYVAEMVRHEMVQRFGDAAYLVERELRPFSRTFQVLPVEAHAAAGVAPVGDEEGEPGGAPVYQGIQQRQPCRDTHQ